MNQWAFETLRSEAPVKGFDERVVGWLAGPGEVERHVMNVGPEIEIAGDELRSLIDPDRAWIACLYTDAIEDLNDILTAITETRINM